MKNAIKRVLKTLGLFENAKKIWHRMSRTPFQKKYGKINSWTLNRRGVQVRYNTADDHSRKWFFPRYDNGNIHEPVATDIFIDLVRNDSIVLDVGGHLGYFTCLASKLASNGQVHVFEVDPKCIPLIEKNVRLNNCTNVYVNNSAVSSHEGFEKIPLLNGPNPSLMINPENANSIKVKAVTIDEYVIRNGIKPDFIKIDVEGAEWKVLNGMKTILGQSGLILLIEIHPVQLEKYFDLNYKIIIDFLQNAGFKIQNIESHRLSESSFKTIDTSAELSGNTMILCRKT